MGINAHIIDDLLRGEPLRALPILSRDEDAHDVPSLLVHDPAVKQAHRELRRDLSDAPAGADRLDGELCEEKGDEGHGAHDEHGDKAAEAEAGVDMALPRGMDLLGLGGLASLEVVPERDTADDVEAGIGRTISFHLRFDFVF